MKSPFIGGEPMKNKLRMLFLVMATWFGLTSQAFAHHYTIVSSEPTVNEGGAMSFEITLNTVPSDGDTVLVHYNVSSGR
jgi:methionine-rich copper-binding protein CopC